VLRENQRLRERLRLLEEYAEAKETMGELKKRI
jgi:hypothetical protein